MAQVGQRVDGRRRRRRRRRQQRRRQCDERQHQARADPGRQRPRLDAGQVGKTGAKRRAGAGQQDLGRTGCDLEHGGQLDGREPVNVLEQQGRLLADAQRLERALEQGAQLSLLERVADGRHVAGVVIGVGGAAAGGGPQVVVTAVQRDAVQPGAQPHLAVARQPFVGANQHVVGDVLGVLAVVDHAQGEVEDADRVEAVQAGQGTRGVPAQLGDQPFVVRLEAGRRLTAAAARKPFTHRPAHCAPASMPLAPVGKRSGRANLSSRCGVCRGAPGPR